LPFLYYIIYFYIYKNSWTKKINRNLFTDRWKKFTCRNRFCI